VLSDLITAEQSAPSPCRLPSLRHIIYGGAAISDEKLRWFEERFGCRITTSYGRSEGGKTWCAPDSDQRWRTHGPVNRDVCELRIVDPKTGLETPVGVPGEIRVRGDGVSLGYWKGPDLNAQVFDRDGWMMTGDRGFVDDERFLHFLGRADGMIKTGGENVSPQEVEQALAQVDGVDDVVVAGVPHPRLGQTVGALIVAKAGSSAQQIQDEARQHLAGFKLPRVIRIVDELPRLGSNKLDMPQVSTLLEEQVGFETEGMSAAT
jgi:acyl-CoA synthetase (AMP-forming)/AMP-acid ligase II